MTPVSLSTLWRIARRDLSASFRGLRLLFLCLFLGVAALAAIGSLTAAITGELTRKGRELLGGDIEVALTQRYATPDEKKIMAGLGQVSETIRLRAMARGGSGPPMLAELKGVDGAYPLYGQLKVSTSAGAKVSPRPGPGEVLIERGLAERLGIGQGQTLGFGRAQFRVAGILDDEPDRVGEGFSLGPAALIRLEDLPGTGLIQPGSLFQTKYRVKLTDSDGSRPERVAEDLRRAHGEAGWQVRDHGRAAPGASRFFERMGQFLGLIGLAALVIAGIGVSNGVSGYLTARRGAIATLKVLGAQGRDITAIYMLQVGAVAGAAVLAGLAAGAAAPSLILSLIGDRLPVRPEFSLHPAPLALAAVQGLLITFIFTWLPLARAGSTPPAAIWRSSLEPPGRPALRDAAIVAGAACLSIGLAILTAEEPWYSAGILAAAAGGLIFLLGVGAAVTFLARRLPRPSSPLLRLAVSNLHRPGSQTPALVIAMGLSLTLFVLIAAIQTSLDAEIARSVPVRAPSQFVLDIPSGDAETFRRVVTSASPGAEVNLVPALRGMIIAYGDQRVRDLKEIPREAWVLRGERGVTYAADLPEGSRITAGEWWPRNYSGPPLVSLDDEVAVALDLEVGDTLTVSVLGREIPARIASLRRIDWDTMGFNYLMVFPPSTLAEAPHTLAGAVTLPPERETEAARAILTSFPGASVISVREVLGQARTLLDQMALAVLAAASVTLLAGMAVLTGAVAAARQSRTYDAVVLKTLGATRAQLLGVQALEYSLLGLLLGGVALALGLGGAWWIIVQVFEFTWAPDWGRVLATLGAGLGVTLILSLAGALPILSARPATALRSV
ncbi:MAG: ABC transporter permease [Phenylobacterium sp.]